MTFVYRFLEGENTVIAVSVSGIILVWQGGTEVWIGRYLRCQRQLCNNEDDKMVDVWRCLKEMQDNRWPPAIIALRQCLMVFLGPQHIPKPCWKHLEAISRYFKVCRIFVQYADCPHTRKAFWSVENLNVSQRVPSPMMSCVGWAFYIALSNVWSCSIVCFLSFSNPIYILYIYMSDIIQLSQHISRWHSGSLANCIRLFIFCSWPELELQEFYSGLISSMYHGWQEFLGTSFLSFAKFPPPFLFFLFPSFTLPFPSPFPRSCESFGQGVKPALGKTIRGKKRSRNKISLQTRVELFPRVKRSWVFMGYGWNFIFEHLLTKNILKKNKNKFLFRYLENDPLNVLNLILDIIYG